MASSSAPARHPSGARDGERGLLAWTAVATAVTALGSLAAGITTPPRSGPNCRGACIGYPYTGGAEFAPRDYWWMYPASLLALEAIALLMLLRRRDGAAGVLAARLSVVLAALAAGALVTDYGIQTAVVQPALIKGETDGIGLLSQYNPHGVFIALENVGYLLLGLAFVAAAVAFDARSRPERVARRVFGVGGALTVVSLIGYALAYRSDLEYRFEVAGLAVDWLVLIVAGVLLAAASRKRPDPGSSAPTGGPGLS